VAAYSSLSDGYQTLKSSTRRKVMATTRKRRKSYKSIKDSIARAGRTAPGGGLKHQTRSQRSKGAVKDPTIDSRGRGSTRSDAQAGFKRAEDRAFGDMPGSEYVRGPGGHGKEKPKGKSRLSRLYGAVDKAVFGGALPGGAKRKKDLDDLVADTSAATKNTRKKKRRRNSRPMHRR
tara:strand:- start:2549 stop:3076 length:528 start_codon:yes stop_codon:yes gene_type:complete